GDRPRSHRRRDGLCLQVRAGAGRDIPGLAPASKERAHPVTQDAGHAATDGYLVPIQGFTSFTTAQGPGKLVFVSGITSRGADGEVRAPGDVAGQTDQIL